jgi:hypothetical protein
VLTTHQPAGVTHGEFSEQHICPPKSPDRFLAAIQEDSMRLQVGHLFEGNIAGGNSTKQNKHATKIAQHNHNLDLAAS